MIDNPDMRAQMLQTATYRARKGRNDQLAISSVVYGVVHRRDDYGFSDETPLPEVELASLSKDVGRFLPGKEYEADTSRRAWREGFLQQRPPVVANQRLHFGNRTRTTPARLDRKPLATFRRGIKC